MKTLAEKLNPPFIAVIMLDIMEANINDGPSPSDEMMSIAPAQEGFLGIETTHDDQGRWISISYWRDEICLKHWRKNGADLVARQFQGLELSSACKFRVSKVDDRILVSTPLTAREKAIPSSSAMPQNRGLGSTVISAFPAIAGLFGYEHAR